MFAESSPVKPIVLVVDDSPAMQRYLRQLLELDSYGVETASDGAEAVRRVREGCSPAVVLLDLQMPGMDGLNTLRSLRKIRPGLKVIMCSGVDDPGQIRRAASLGAWAYLTKPVQHLCLSAAVHDCLSASAMDRESQDPRSATHKKTGRAFFLPTPSR